ncbi:MAG: histidine kinase dimerization/phospho-acceptor domain-containing protein [Pseudomonadota bacterium]
MPDNTNQRASTSARLMVLAVPLCLSFVAFGLLLAVALSDRSPSVSPADRSAPTKLLNELRADLAELSAELALAGAIVDDTVPPTARLNDAIWGKLQVLQTSPQAAELREHDQSIGALPALSAVLDAHKTDLTAGRPAPRDGVELAVLLSGRLPALSELSGSLKEPALLPPTDRSEVALMLALAVAGALTAFLSWQALYRPSEVISDGADEGKVGKERFLSMISHELRTPMNGIIGLIALARQSNLSPPQDRLLEQAQRSGTDMSDLLNDIIDFSDIEDDRLEINAKPFRLGDFGDQLGQALDLHRVRTGRTVELRLRGSDQIWILGDPLRLKQILIQLCRFAAESGDGGELQLNLWFRDGEFSVDIACAGVLRLDAAGRPLGFVLGGHRESRGEPGVTRANTLGIVIARRLAVLMGGGISAERLRPERNRISLRVPVEVVSRPQSLVRVVTVSETTEAVFRTVLLNHNQELWDESCADEDVMSIFIESGAIENASQFSDLRERHPYARLISVGRPSDPDVFDQVCADLFDQESVLRALDGDTTVTESYQNADRIPR